MRPFIHNHYLPQWLHRMVCGGFATVLLVLLGLNWLNEPYGSWRHILSLCLLVLSVPAGIVFACVAHRFSIVEGLAGGAGYEDLDAKPEQKSPAQPHR
jgi:hypothetical protein